MNLLPLILCILVHAGQEAFCSPSTNQKTEPKTKPKTRQKAHLPALTSTSASASAPAPPALPLFSPVPADSRQNCPSPWSELRREVSQGMDYSSDDLGSPDGKTPDAKPDHADQLRRGLLTRRAAKSKLVDSQFSIPLLSDSQLEDGVDSPAPRGHQHGILFLQPGELDDLASSRSPVKEGIASDDRPGFWEFYESHSVPDFDTSNMGPKLVHLADLKGESSIPSGQRGKQSKRKLKEKKGTAQGEL